MNYSFSLSIKHVHRFLTQKKMSDTSVEAAPTECPISEEALKAYKKVRLSSSKSMMVLTLKIEKDTNNIIIDEQFNECSFDDLQLYLDDTNLQPRYLILSYAWQRSDRVQYPLMFIFYTPKNANPYDQSMFFSVVVSCTHTRECEIYCCYYNCI